MIAYKQIQLKKFYFNEHLTHSCVGMPQGLQALSSSFLLVFWELCYLAKDSFNGHT